MQNLIPRPTSSPAHNLRKNTGRYVENTNTKSSFFHSSSKINNYYFIIFLRRPILDLKFPLMIHPTIDGDLGWRSTSSVSSDFDDALENWQNQLHEVSFRKCGLIT